MYQGKTSGPSIRGMLGQCFCAGFEGTEISPEFEEFLETYQIGNVILFSRNIVSCPQLKELCGQIQQIVRRCTGRPAFIMIDQEGGIVTRLPEDAVQTPGAMALAATGDPQKAYRAGRLTGKQLAALGVNFDLAPVLDVNSNPDNPSVGVRSFGDKPEQVAEYGKAMMRGILEEHVLACAKHFPGHGDTALDSHISLPCVDKPVEDLERVDIYPFREAIQAGIPAIMTTHILFPTLEEEKIPATMSEKIITGLLRERLGFQGLVLSDCLQMEAINTYYGSANGAVAAIKAGVDILLFSSDMEKAREAYEKIEAELEGGTLDLQRIEQASGRVLSFKGEYLKEPKEPEITEEDWEEARELFRRSVTPVRLPQGKIPELGENPIFIGSGSVRSCQVMNPEESDNFAESMAYLLGGGYFTFSVNPSEEEAARALEAVKGHTAIVLGVTNASLRPGQRKILEEICAQQLPVIVIALRNPYDLRDVGENVTAIAAWEYSSRVFPILAELLKGEWLPKGRQPVSISSYGS